MSPGDYTEPTAGPQAPHATSCGCSLPESRDSQRVTVPVFRPASRVSVGEKRGLAPAKRSGDVPVTAFRFIVARKRRRFCHGCEHARGILSAQGIARCGHVG